DQETRRRADPLEDGPHVKTGGCPAIRYRVSTPGLRLKTNVASAVRRIPSKRRAPLDGAGVPAGPLTTCGFVFSDPVLAANVASPL
ncbi:MAG TPA: hypothetical protein VN893_08960, partial [Bryobacteraceae bacterium]|nr:hypothetical protein [Bryobacteraceae bacterium]